jgi:DNA-binding response OmpR family regulator
MEKKKILLLEDDITLNETITEYLEEQGYAVDSVENGEDAIDKIYENNYDLLLLDVKVPHINGFDLLKEVRKNNNTTPAIFITSLDSIDDLSEGYESGCDDYIRKPFALKELAMRMATILKRDFFHTNSEKIKIDEHIEYDINGNILYVDGEEVSLNKKESKLLKLFLQNQNQILSHERIYDAVWEYDENASEASLRTYIKNLRKVLGKDKIVSIKKQGYKFTQSRA